MRKVIASRKDKFKKQVKKPQKTPKSSLPDTSEYAATAEAAALQKYKVKTVLKRFTSLVDSKILLIKAELN